MRKSTIFSEYLTENMKSYGGLVEFYRSEERKMWTDSGQNVPYYARMSALWWGNIALAITGEVTPREALDTLAEQQDDLMASLKTPLYSPRLNEEKSREYWLSMAGSPKPYREEEEPLTISYDKLLMQWQESGL